MNIVIKNSNNNILFKKRKKKRFLGCPKVTFFQIGFEPALRKKISLSSVRTVLPPVQKKSSKKTTLRARWTGRSPVLERTQ